MKLLTLKPLARFFYNITKVLYLKILLIIPLPSKSCSKDLHISNLFYVSFLDPLTTINKEIKLRFS